MCVRVFPAGFGLFVVVTFLIPSDKENAIIAVFGIDTDTGVQYSTCTCEIRDITPSSPSETVTGDDDTAS